MRSCPEVKSLSGYRALSLIAIGFITVLILCALPVTAIKVGGSVFSGTIAPGSSTVHVMNISTSSSDPPMDLMVDVQGLGQNLQLSSSGVPADKDTTPYSARTFITVSPKTFHLEPGASQEVWATIAVPKDVGDGGRYAMITIRNAPIGNGTTVIVTAISVPVIIAIGGTPKNMNGTITNVTVADVIPGQPITITTTLKNTGNYPYKVKNNVTVADSAGKVVASVGSDLTSRSIVPTYFGEFDVNLVKPLPIGKYTITSVLTREDGSVIDTKTVPFEIKEPYVAPSDEATVSLTMKSPAVLNTTDGRFTINFPAGAVLSDVTVTIKPVSADKVQPAPQGATLGGTNFRLDGLTGLLSKDATIVVKYSSADVDAAKGDVSKLALARYDESDNKWTIVPTTVDRNAQTLTATTNRFSTWAVMVTSGETAGGTSTGKTGLALDPIIAFAALGLSIMVVGYRIRK
jgi:hypothetical protein